MLNCASIFTCEIDDLEAAFNELKLQLDKKLKVLEHTAGIIMCHPEFISSGVVEYICKNLPFDIVGITTCAQAANGEIGDYILTIFVITSGDVWFRAGVTEGLEESIDKPLKAAIDNAVTGVSESPALALIFPPLIYKYSGDSYVEAVQKIFPNVPIFGSIPVDDTLSFELSETIYKGANHKTAMPFLLCYGNINPRFIVGTFPEGNVIPYKGEITKSSGMHVHEINNTNAYEFFEGIGFVENGALANNMGLIPFALDQKARPDYDGIPVIRAIAFLLEDGTAVFRGEIDEGSTFSILSSDTEGVLSATTKKIEELNNLSNVNGALVFSCLGRRMMTMHDNPLLELEAISNTINCNIPFTIGYSGGEISPTLVKNGVPTNRYHNYSLIILVI